MYVIVYHNDGIIFYIYLESDNKKISENRNRIGVFIRDSNSNILIIWVRFGTVAKI